MTAERRRRDRYGRRFTIALIASIVVHLVIGAFFAIRNSVPPGGAREDVTSAVTVTVAHAPRPIATARPSAAPRQTRPRPARVATIVPPAVRHAAPPARVTRPAHGMPRRPELARIAATGSPVPGPLATVEARAPAAQTLTLRAPLVLPSTAPTIAPTVAPTIVPIAAPSIAPTAAPTVQPTAVATVAPTAVATLAPTAVPTAKPTVAPTAKPTVAPTTAPSVALTAAPTAEPTAAATAIAAATSRPTAAPSARPALTSAPAPASTVAAAAKAVASAPAAARGVAAGASPAAKAPGNTGSGSPGPAAAGKGASSAVPGSGSPASGSVAPAAPATAASAAPGAQNGGSGIDALNRRLNGLLPTSGNVAFSDKHYENPNLNDIISRAQSDYYKAAAPPPSVLAKAIAVVKQRGMLLGPPAVLYILERQRVLGFEICTGWYVTQTPAGPQGGYTVGTCKGEAVIPSGGLPTLPPRPPAP